MFFDLDFTSGFQIATYPAGATFGPRALRDYELVWMIEGDAVYLKGDAVFDAPQGSMVLCQPNTHDFFRWDPRRRTRHGWFHFHLVGAPPPDWGTPDTWATVRIPHSETDLIPTLFRHLIISGPDRGGVPISTTERLLAMTLLSRFVSENEVTGTSIENPQYPEAVTRAMAFVAAHLEEHPGDTLPLQKIAGAAFVSPEHLCRLFKAHTGHTPAETVRLMRLDRAVVLLARTNYSVGEIATLSGFPSQFHFARRFKEAFRQTPSELRRAITSGRSAIPVSLLLRVTGAAHRS
ncbi:MAG: helix-turn-helix transcriptional regulator [Fibrella sp.]|nr:helix-turn-helix transcriptional regulator [Armatimonadota bacterium]